MLASLFLLLLPFCQTGVNYYASVSTLLAILAVVLYWSSIFRGVLRSPWLGPVVVVMFLPTIFNGVDLLQELLRTARESLLLVILVGAIRGAEVERPRPISRPASQLLFVLLTAFFVMAALQTVLYSRNVYFGLPKDLYIMGTGTIADETRLGYSEGNLRPSATYSEPSYLGLVLLSLAMVIGSKAQTRRGKVMLGLIVVTGLLSRSASFLLTGALMLVVPAIVQRRRGGANLRTVGLALLVALPVFLFTKAGALLDRLSKASSSPTADFSAQMRLVGPIEALPGYLSDHPFGLPISQALKVLPQYYPSEVLAHGFGSDNALFNFFFSYGLLAVIPLAAIFLAARDLRIKLFLFSCMMFNGGFLRADITAMMVFAALNYLSPATEVARRPLQKARTAPPRARFKRPLAVQRAR